MSEKNKNYSVPKFGYYGGKYKEKVFKAWNRGELSAKEIAKSTGIPLRIVRQYIPLTKEG